MIGQQITKDQLNQLMGDNTTILHREYIKAVSIKEFFDRTSDATLVALGFVQSEVNIMKSAYADLAFQKTSAFDSSQNVKLLYGTGI